MPILFLEFKYFYFIITKQEVKALYVSIINISLKIKKQAEMALCLLDIYWSLYGQFGIEIQEFCTYQGFPGGSVVKNLPAKARQHGFDPWSRKIPHASGKLSLLSPHSRAWGLQ